MCSKIRQNPALNVDPDDRRRLLEGEHHEPHRVLGAHPAPGEDAGVIVRAYHPDAVGADCLPETGEPVTLEPLGEGGLFAGVVPDASLPLSYRLRFHFDDEGNTLERDDPYRFLPTVGEMDLHLFNEGSHRRLWQALGAHVREIDGVRGTSFAVWAPNALRVSVVGDFCDWDGRRYPMRVLGSSGIWEIFIPGVGPNALYKFEIKTRDRHLKVKADPFASWMEAPPATGCRVYESSYEWEDSEWLTRRAGRAHHREPMSIYEAHLGSWARVPEEDNRPLSYREIAPRLVEHLKEHNFTHLELLPVAEHPFTGSWGYQVTGYYAPTARYGSPDDLRYLIDLCHQNGIGVILDWVPAHFPKDDFSLPRFDGTALYEHFDPRRGEHPDWGTLIFNYGRNEVRSFLVANALYWLEEFHVDGLRVDAVASMLYLDYSRKEGEWEPNLLGGRENLEAVGFLRQLNTTMAEEHPDCITIAEESTAWPGVSRPISQGGLGFTFKWNMGWMHDTLEYFRREPVHRRFHQDQLTFAMVYEYSENFIMPLSHDEVVHGKGSLLNKMPGDEWQKFANLRTLLTYQYTRPGKQLLFMGTELAPESEWSHDSSLDWHREQDPLPSAFGRFLSDLGRLYLDLPPLWKLDPDPTGFTWIDSSDHDNSVVSYVRRDDEGNHAVVVLNLTPVARDDYRIGAPSAATYVERLNSDDRRYGGSEVETHAEVQAEPVPLHGYAHSLNLRLPPLGALVLTPSDA